MCTKPSNPAISFASYMNHAVQASSSPFYRDGDGGLETPTLCMGPGFGFWLLSLLSLLRAAREDGDGDNRQSSRVYSLRLTCGEKFCPSVYVFSFFPPGQNGTCIERLRSS